MSLEPSERGEEPCVTTPLASRTGLIYAQRHVIASMLTPTPPSPPAYPEAR
jgi:hypothetical protein